MTYLVQGWHFDFVETLLPNIDSELTVHFSPQRTSTPPPLIPGSPIPVEEVAEAVPERLRFAYPTVVTAEDLDSGMPNSVRAAFLDGSDPN